MTRLAKTNIISRHVVAQEGTAMWGKVEIPNGIAARYIAGTCRTYVRRSGDEWLVSIKKRFDEERIEIPFHHRTIYTGSAAEAFPIIHSEERN